MRPVVGVTGPDKGAIGPRVCIHLALLLAGGRPRHLRPRDAVDTSRLDGIIVSGGHDIEPTLYKAAAEVKGNYDPARDRFESAVIDSALNDGTPILGICRGAQLLNVRLGGTLHQDLSKRRHLTSKRRFLLPLKTLCLVEGSKLEAILGEENIRINSLHNQSIDSVGRRLQICGRDLDDIVQAVEDASHRFLTGVQWHPEFLIYAARQRRIFRELVAAAREYREEVSISNK